MSAIKTNLKDAVFLISTAWDVSESTIKNCRKKAGFPDVVTAETNDPFAEEDDDMNELWHRMTNYCSDLRDVAFSDFLALDTDLATESAYTEEEATIEALKAVQPQPASAEAGVNNDSSDEDVEEICTVQETKTLRPSEATENVRALRDFLLTARNTFSEEQRHFVQCLGAMEDAFLRVLGQNKDSRK